MNDRGQYGKQVSVGASTVKTFATGALAGGILVGVGLLWLRHSVAKQQELVADINRYRPRTA